MHIKPFSKGNRNKLNYVFVWLVGRFKRSNWLNWKPVSQGSTYSKIQSVQIGSPLESQWFLGALRRPALVGFTFAMIFESPYPQRHQLHAWSLENHVPFEELSLHPRQQGKRLPPGILRWRELWVLAEVNRAVVFWGGGLQQTVPRNPSHLVCLYHMCDKNVSEKMTAFLSHWSKQICGEVPRLQGASALHDCPTWVKTFQQRRSYVTQTRIWLQHKLISILGCSWPGADIPLLGTNGCCGPFRGH